MIHIKSQDAFHQYDEGGNPITTWDSKKCSWIINREYENERIDWWGKDNDFPGGCTLSQFVKDNPNWDKKPDISVTWYWENEESCVKAFGQPWTFQHPATCDSNYWKTMKYPYTANKNWEHLDYEEKEAISQLGKYCGFNKFAYRVTVRYNGKLIHDGPLS